MSVFHALTSVSVALAALAAGSAQAKPADADARVREEFQRRLETRLAAVIAANQQATTYESWVRGGLLPESAFALARELPRTPQERAHSLVALCNALGRLSPANLSLFEHALKHDSGSVSAACLERLRLRIRLHWSRQEERLRALAGPKPPKTPPLTTREVFIPADHGGVFFVGGLAEGEFALTFDDGPDASRTPRIARELRAAGVRATFFPIGRDARANPEVIRDLAADGHTVGSHTWSHPLLTDLPEEKAQSEITSGASLIRELIGSFAAGYFRFPYGARNNGLQEYVRSEGLATFFWNLDSLDWKIRDATALYQHVLREMDYRKGGIILMHANLEQTVIVIPYLLQRFRDKGLRPAVFIDSAAR